MAAEEAEAEADAAVDLHALERDVGGLALDDAGDVEDDDAGSFGSADDEETPADAFLSLQMVCAKNFPPDFLCDEARDAESLACAVERLEHVRLDRCGLVSLLGSAGSGPGSSTPPALTAATISSAPLRSLRNVVSLYLQKNRLVDLGGAINAETTPRLRFLALSDNALFRIELDGDRYVGEERLLVDLLPYIRDVRQGPDGLLYIVTHTDSGGLYRLEPA